MIHFQKVIWLRASEERLPGRAELVCLLPTTANSGQ